jgi:glucose-6-phosphate isomerase
MIKIDLINLMKVGSRHGLSGKDLFAKPCDIKKLLEKFGSRKQGFHQVLDDRDTVERIKAFAAETRGRYKDIMVLGIGGSALGTICLQQSLKHLYVNELAKQDEYPKLHVLDNIDPALIADAESVINVKSTLFIVITKSGSTPETLAQFIYFLDKVKRAKLDPGKHFVIVTDKPDRKTPGPLRGFAKKYGIKTFDIPGNVGGRFSVLTAVGLLPAALIGIDIARLLEGATKMRKSFLSEDCKSNLPWQIASVQYLMLKKGKTINVMMPYSQKLIRFADWYRQLLAESIGKKGMGITPVSALGVTDQHSQNQLYNDGPNDKLFIFMKVLTPGPELVIKPDAAQPELSYLKNLTFGRLLETEMKGTIGALTEKNRPNLTVEIPEVDEFHLGGLFMLFEAATAFLGEMLDINAYNQPGVERSKEITKKLLTKK